MALGAHRKLKFGTHVDFGSLEVVNLRYDLREHLYTKFDGPRCSGSHISLRGKLRLISKIQKHGDVRGQNLPVY